eukprot:11213340-Lingulodinium_polyedra.AAC.1
MDTGRRGAVLLGAKTEDVGARAASFVNLCRSERFERRALSATPPLSSMKASAIKKEEGTD